MRPIPFLFGLAACVVATNVLMQDGGAAGSDSPALNGVGVAAGSGAGKQAVFIPPASSTPATGLSLADALTLERRASLWFDYARDVASVVSVVVVDGRSFGEGT